MSEVHTLFSWPWSNRRLTRSGIDDDSGSGRVVIGVQPRGLMPTIRLLRISFATVFRDTVSPSSRKSAKIRGDPYTWSESAWNVMILFVSDVRRCCAGVGPACCRRIQA